MADELSQVEPQKKRGGEWVTFGLEQYRIPPLSFGALKELASKFEIAQKDDAPNDQRFDAVLDVVTLALQRNYPDITKAFVADLIDTGNFMAVFHTIARIAGMLRAQDQPPGEAGASTGTEPTSP
jgi:hypothetical protein